MDGEADRLFLAVLDGIACVDREVEEHLLNLGSLGNHHRRMASEIGIESDGARQDLPQQRQEVAGNRAQVKGNQTRRLLAKELGQLTDHILGLRRGRLDLLEVFADTRWDIRLLAGELSESSDDKDQIVEVMDDGGRMVSDGLQALGDREHLLHALLLAGEPALSGEGSCDREVEGGAGPDGEEGSFDVLHKQEHPLVAGVGDPNSTDRRDSRGLRLGESVDRRYRRTSRPAGPLR